jgi:RNA polymerase sigma-70 factor (ECF subfamily)
MLNDRAAAEDIVQDAAVIAYQRARDFVPGSNFTAWLAEIVRRCALNYRRNQKSRRTYAADPAELARLNGRPSAAAEPSPIAPTSGELLDDQAAFDDELLAALQQLSAEARCCLLLRTVEKLSYAEIAVLMKMPEGTAMSHVHRSRTSLRKMLSEGSATNVESGSQHV